MSTAEFQRWKVRPHGDLDQTFANVGAAFGAAATLARIDCPTLVLDPYGRTFLMMRVDPQVTITANRKLT